MNISRKTVSKWELDTVQPEMDKAVIPCFEADGEDMDIYIACK